MLKPMDIHVCDFCGVRDERTARLFKQGSGCICEQCAVEVLHAILRDLKRDGIQQITVGQGA